MDQFARPGTNPDGRAKLGSGCLTFSLCASNPYPQTSIDNARILQKWSVDRTKHYRLVWSIGDAKSDNAPVAPTSVHADTGAKSSQAPPLPWSSLTGSFEYFDLLAGGKEKGRAYAKDFILEKKRLLKGGKGGMAR